MRKFTVTLTLFIEAVSSFEAINEFEGMVRNKIPRLEKYEVVELFDQPKADPPIIINDNEL